MPRQIGLVLCALDLAVPQAVFFFEPSRDQDQRLELLFEESGVDPGTELRELLTAARRGRTELSDEASQELLKRVLAAAQVRFRRRHAGVPLRLAAVLAAGLAVGAVLWPRNRPAAPPGDLVVKEVFFESVYQGKVTRLEMTLYRTRQQ